MNSHNEYWYHRKVEESNLWDCSNILAEVGNCAAIIAARACGATILLAIALAPQLVSNGCADACAASVLAILNAIAQKQFKYD